VNDAAEITRQALLWGPAFSVIFVSNVSIATWGKPLGKWRLLVVIPVALSPLLAPLPQARQAPWGALSTVLTTLAIVTAARLPDWDHFLRNERTFLERYFWLSLPMVRSRSRRPWVQRRGPGLGFIGLGLLKVVVWQGVFHLANQFSVESIPWLLKSLMLMLYFVLNLTATHDVLAGFSILVGFDIDALFDKPFLATSPRDFWSRRWNKFISRFALKHVALRVRKMSSPLWTIMSVFFVSGLFHEYFAWGVGGEQAAHGYMTSFFLIQGLVVWLGDRFAMPSLHPVLGNALTFLWMALTAPLFFKAVQPALSSFEYPLGWYPF
jgi:hypothetical protein